MKSALLAQASVCVAGGLDWQGKRNRGAVGVVYFALERADLVEKRIKAHCLRLGLTSLPIAVVAATIDLIKPDSVKRVITTIQEVGKVFGVDVGFVVFDTFAKLIAAGGGDENQAKDQGAVFANVERIKNATGTHVAIIGHTGKDVQKGARGSNAILGDVDIMVEISGDIVRTATVTKANDMPEGPLFSFKSDLHEFGIDEDGDPIAVNVVSSEPISQSESKLREPRLKPNQRTVFAILQGAGPAGLTLYGSYKEPNRTEPRTQKSEPEPNPNRTRNPDHRIENLAGRECQNRQSQQQIKSPICHSESPGRTKIPRRGDARKAVRHPCRLPALRIRFPRRPVRNSLPNPKTHQRRSWSHGVGINRSLVRSS